MIKVQSIFYFLLLLFPVAASDFLPTGLIALLSSLLIIRIYTYFPKLLIFTIIIGSIYYLRTIYGNSIIPESTVSFLSLMCLARMLEKEHGDYKTNRFLGFLWAGSFVLFRTDLTSILLLSLTTFFILKTLPLENDKKITIKDLLFSGTIKWKDIFLGVATVIILFIFFPRIYNFLPTARVQPRGTIGYTKDINNSSNIQLNLSSQTAFYAQMDKIENSELYWRGRVHVITDGYNWRSKEITSRIKTKIPSEGIITYQMKYEQDFDGDIILLDTPTKITSTNLRGIKNNEFHTYRLYNKKKKVFLTAESILDKSSLATDTNNLKDYLKIPKSTLVTIKDFAQNFKNHKNLNDLLVKFENYITNNKFFYTLSPKGASTLKNFIANKQGFCTHYASLLGITLRYFKYPARLVSGFQGGRYNEIGNHYKVSSNDAHAWVEVYNGNYWQRVDPTSFIAPNRVLMGGENFFTGQDIISARKNRNTFINWYYNSRQFWDNLNYKVSLFFDTYDRENQTKIARSFRLKRWAFVSVGLIFIFIIFLILYFSTKEAKKYKLEIDELFDRFSYNAKKHGVLFKDTDNLERLKDKVLSSNLNKDYIDFLHYYQMSKYSKSKNYKKLKEILDKIK